MNKPRHALLALACAAALLVSACGGGGGNDDGALAVPNTPPSSTYGPSTDFAGVCTAEGQKRWVRSYLDEVYYWYREVPAVDAAAYANPVDYFHALLVRTPDVNGLPKDRFSAAIPTSQVASALARSYGQPLAAEGPNLLANPNPSVPEAKVVTSPAGRRAGYIQFTDHEEGAQDQLVHAVRALQAQQVQDVVLDMRFNAGGFLYVSLAAGSMLASPAAEGKVFETLRYNDKRTLESSSSFLAFSTRLQFAEEEFPRDTVLPQLGLPRVYVLASNQTCSSSESLINALRGIDVDVVLVGEPTCGKPYGFREKQNCGISYFPIEFQGFNAKGFGDYTAGFAPTCPVPVRGGAAVGGANDRLLNAALHHMDTGNCPTASALGALLSSGSPQATPGTPVRPPWAGRLLRDR